MRLFENGKHLVYYKPANLPGLAAWLKQWTSEKFAEERCAIARAGAEEVQAHHTLEKRLAVMFETVGLASKAAAAVN